MKFGNVRLNRVTPTITAGAYLSGRVVGAATELGPIGSHNGSGILKTVAVVDRNNQKSALTLLFFEGPTTGTFTDTAAPSFSAADLAAFLGKVEIAATDYTALGGVAFATVDVANVIRSKDTREQPVVINRSLFCVICTNGTPTFASAADLTFIFGLLLD